MSGLITAIIIVAPAIGVFLACREQCDGENALCGGMLGMFAAIPIVAIVAVFGSVI